MCEDARQHPFQIAVITGGPGPEHVASIESTLGVLEYRKTLGAEFQFHLCIITREEVWLCESESEQYLQLYASEGRNNLHKVDSLARKGFLTRSPQEILAKADIVFPIIHGELGEDGVILGLCRALKKPYVGCGIISSVMCLDKTVCNAVLSHAGIPQISHEVTLPGEYAVEAMEKLEKRNLSPPLIVKPANGGCSIGVSIIRDLAELPTALEKSREQYPCSPVIVELAVEDMMELDVGVLENDCDTYLLTTPCGLRRNHCHDPLPNERRDSVSYIRETHQHGEVPDWAVPAPEVPPAAQKRMQELAKQIFKVVRARIWLRVDFFFVPSTGQIFVNEINSMPSLASGAMLLKLWTAAGISPLELIRRVVRQSLYGRSSEVCR